MATMMEFHDTSTRLCCPISNRQVMGSKRGCANVTSSSVIAHGKDWKRQLEALLLSVKLLKLSKHFATDLCSDTKGEKTSRGELLNH